MIPKTEKHRTADATLAGLSLVKALSPTQGYNPGQISQTMADAILRAIDSDPDLLGDGIDYDLALECVELILSGVMIRLSERPTPKPYVVKETFTFTFEKTVDAMSEDEARNLYRQSLSECPRTIEDLVTSCLNDSDVSKIQVSESKPQV